MATPKSTVDTVVVGAGVSGLIAARELVLAGRDVLVLEARDRVGGRLLNAALPDGSPIEMGGEWVGPGQHEVLGLLDSMGIGTFPTHLAGRHIAEVNGHRTTYTGRIPRLNPVVLADIAAAQWRLNRLAARVPRVTPWAWESAARLDGQTFATWIGRHLRTQGGRAFMRLVTEAVFATEPEDLSTLWVCHYIGSAGGFDPVIETEGGAQQDRVVGGTQRIALELADQLGDRVVLDSPVTGLEWSADEVRLATRAASVRARTAIIAIPPPLAGRIHYSPALPADRDQLTQRLPMGRVIKVNVVYDEPFWRADGFSGQANSDHRAAGTVFDNTPQSGSPGVLVAFLEGRHADECARLSAVDRRASVLTDLSGYFGRRAGTPIAYLERDWAAEEYTRGCYGAFAVPATLSRFGAALRAPIGPLHWAGTETATRWIGYIDGAIEAGKRAAGDVCAALDAGAAGLLVPARGQA